MEHKFKIQTKTKNCSKMWFFYEFIFRKTFCLLDFGTKFKICFSFFPDRKWRLMLRKVFLYFTEF